MAPGEEAWLVQVTASETDESLLKHASDVNTASTAQVPLDKEMGILRLRRMAPWLRALAILSDDFGFPAPTWQPTAVSDSDQGI